MAGEKLTKALSQLADLRRLGIIKPKGYDLLSPWSLKARLRFSGWTALATTQGRETGGGVDG